MARLKRFLKAAMFGDCDYCGHSVAYHMPLVGCAKCSCSEYH